MKSLIFKEQWIKPNAKPRRGPISYYDFLIKESKVILTEESYTSKASFLDEDNIPTYQSGITNQTFSAENE